MLTAIKPRQWRALQHWQRELAAGARIHQHAPDGTRRAALTGRHASATSARSTTPTADICIRCAIRSGWRAPPSPPASRSTKAAAVRELAPRWAIASACAPPRASVDCAQLVLAGNAWLGRTAPALQRKLMTIGSYIIATEPLGEQRARALIANNAAICDTNWILDYFRRSQRSPAAVRRPRQLFGRRSARESAPATAQRMLRVFPQLAGARIDYAWGCLLDITLNRAPHFGRLQPNIYFPAGLLRPRHRAGGHRRGAGCRGHGRQQRALRRIRPHCRTAISRAACGCAGRHWSWRCSGIVCAICYERVPAHRLVTAVSRRIAP